MTVTSANDANVPIERHYGPSPDDPVLRRWIEHRSAADPPYRPRAMIYTGQGTPAMTAERIHMLQEVGAESVLLACDLPSQLGFDADHRLARAQVGRAGVSCATLDDMRTIADGIDLSTIDSVGMLANSIGHVGLPLVHEVLRERGGDGVRLVMQNDPLKEFTARGTELFTPEQSVRLACDTIAYAVDHDIPGYSITVCSNHYDVAGAGPVTALALALANAITYLEELVARGYRAEDVARQMMLFVNERSDLFVGAAVFRCARRLWGRLLMDRFGVDESRLPPVVLMGYAHGLESDREPLANIARCTLSVAAAVLGGADYLCAASYDEALRVPSPDAAALAVRTLRTVGAEHGVAASVDPLGGSHKLAEIDSWVGDQVESELARIDERGGALACLRDGYISDLIDRGRGSRQRQLEQGERTFVGENTLQAPQWHHLFAGGSAPPSGLVQAESELRERVSQHKRRHAGAAMDSALDEVRRAAAGNDNVVGPSARALRHGATAEQVVTATRVGFEGQ